MAQAIPERRRQTLFTPFPLRVNHYAVTTAKDITIPAGITAVILNSDADIWLADGTAVVPSGDVTTGLASFFLAKGIPRGFDVTPGQTISVVAVSGTAHVSAELF